MGVYYPPHLLLYGLLPLEAAYTASLVLHTLWAGLGAYWAARRFGVSPAGRRWPASPGRRRGFFVIHLPHQWGYTAGSWMPWAWGLAWVLVERPRDPAHAVAPGPGPDAPGPARPLPARLLHPGRRRPAEPGGTGANQACGVRVPVGGVVAVALAMLAVVPLAAMQLWPTCRLARLAASQRDYEYLSGFAATPVHLVSYVAPGLFQRSPLWRPLAWDPFHTSPEEHLAYIGLVPLFLALGAWSVSFAASRRREPLACWRWRRLILSLGPYVPGFQTLIRLPGFSFFRAPARWGLATELALCLLAGGGSTRCRAWPRPGRALVRFVVVAALAPLPGRRRRSSWRSRAPSGRAGPGLGRESVRPMAARFIPGPIRDGPTPTSAIRGWMDRGASRQDDDRGSRRPWHVRGAVDPGAAACASTAQRWSIYRRELGGTAALLAALLVVAAAQGRSPPVPEVRHSLP